MKAKILIIEDNEDMGFTLANVLKKQGHEAFTAITGEKGLEIIKHELIDLVLCDLKLPKMDGLAVLNEIKSIDSDIVVLMMTANTEAKPAIEAMKLGAFDYLVKPFELEEMKLVVSNALETHQLKREVARLKRDHVEANYLQAIYGESNVIKDVCELIEIVAQTPKTSVLIQGESGTGKELVANAIHYASQRAGKPFIKLNCSAIPENLLESELFGHEKGAFTDAKLQKKGLFEMANGGTIFLDEISSMKFNLQPKLLRVIETQTFRRIGGISDINIDVRVMAASNADIGELVKLKEFRDDLYYRLKVMEITLPTLRDRGNDILLLAKIFLQEYNREFNKNISGFSQETESMLLRYPWPGNVRELKNVIERGVILCRENIMNPEHFPIEIRGEKPVEWSTASYMGQVPLEDVEKHHILEVLKSVDGNKSQAAKILNISRSTLREKLKMYGYDND
ncbi:sigma-54-dependent Fis family transcriptional regulator [bacterium]|nr:sigma-54-dependent Fis family transcriptional regulator [bacterium]